MPASRLYPSMKPRAMAVAALSTARGDALIARHLILTEALSAPRAKAS